MWIGSDDHIWLNALRQAGIQRGKDVTATLAQCAFQQPNTVGSAKGLPPIEKDHVPASSREGLGDFQGFTFSVMAVFDLCLNAGLQAAQPGFDFHITISACLADVDF